MRLPMRTTNRVLPGILATFLTALASAQTPLTAGFTYQGRLTVAGQPAEGTHDLIFVLYDVESGGGNNGLACQCIDNVTLADGLLTVRLNDAGELGENAFNGNERWVEVRVRADATPGNCPGGCGIATGFTPLLPRQKITAAPHASYALQTSWSGLTGVPEGFADGVDNTGGLTLPFAGSGSAAGSLLTIDNTFAGAGDPKAIHGIIDPGSFTFGEDYPAAVFGQNNDTSSLGYGVWGKSAGGTGVYGQSVNAGDGVFGRAEGGIGNGVRGIALGAGDGVLGASSGTGVGVRGQGNTGVRGEGSTSGVYGESVGATGRAVHGVTTHATGPAIGVWGNSVSPAGRGVVGQNNAASGDAMGVLGLSSSTAGYGVWGAGATGVRGASIAGDGVWGESTTGPGVHGTSSGRGVLGESTGPSGRGVYGAVSHATGAAVGVWGNSVSPAGRGVVGANDATTGNGIGVVGDSDSPSGYGVYGSGGVGVYGVANHAFGTGVYGQADPDGYAGLFHGRTRVTEHAQFDSSATFSAGALVEGSTLVTELGIVSFGLNSFQAQSFFNGPGPGTTTVQVINNFQGARGIIAGTSGANAIAITAVAENSGSFAGHFIGDVHVDGDLSKTGGAFKIDHPSDPENKYLVHSFVESPDRMNVYNGNIVTDDQGVARVELPTYFETLNRDFRYQLTVLGAFAQAVVWQKVQDDAFVIRTDKPGVEVSWQVTGIRKDPWAQANPLITEPEKPEQERGYYLNPELYGQPAERRFRSEAWRAAVVGGADAPGAE